MITRVRVIQHSKATLTPPPYTRALATYTTDRVTGGRGGFTDGRGSNISLKASHLEPIPDINGCILTAFGMTTRHTDGSARKQKLLTHHYASSAVFRKEWCAAGSPPPPACTQKQIVAF
eukprot:1180119-Prorocentrum_minimum.AAC.2